MRTDECHAIYMSAALWFTGSSISLGSTVLTAFDQLQDSQPHPDDVQARRVHRRRCTGSRRRATSQPGRSDDGQSSTMPSSTMISQPTMPMNLAEDCQRSPAADLPSSSSSSSQHHHGTTKLFPSTVDASDSPAVDRQLRGDSPVLPCAVSSPGSSGGGGGGKCDVHLSSSYASRVVAEIVDTERKYVRDLRQIVQVSRHLALLSVITVTIYDVAETFTGVKNDTKKSDNFQKHYMQNRHTSLNSYSSIYGCINILQIKRVV